MVNVNWSIIEVMHCFIQNVSYSLGGEMGHGREWGGPRGQRERVEPQEETVTSGPKFIDKLVGQTMK